MPLWNFLKRGYEDGDWSGLKEEVVDFDTIYNSKNICKTNDVRRKVNKMCMEHFKDLTDAIYLLAPKKDEILVYEKSQDIWLYNGLPIMSITNNCKLDIINSEEFNVVYYDDEKICIEREGDGEGIEIDIDDFHKLFVANYCATTHKSQGATYDCKVLIWEWNKMTNDRKMCYTACSRATDIDNLIICNNLIS
jgi:ATP-dependent exoDNAse (exonuclease V) alpha subunit